MDKVPILRITDEGTRRIEDSLVSEFRLTIVLNNRELVTLLCSPAKLESLAVGFLDSEGLIASRDVLKEITLDDEGGTITVTTTEPEKFADDLLSRRLIGSSGAKGSFRDASDSHARIETRVEVAPSEIFKLVGEFVCRSELFRATGGVHSAALCDSSGILVFAEDIGRHNAIDKVFGQCLLEERALDRCMLITSGRVSSEIVHKVAKRNIPVLISKSAPTDLGVTAAGDAGITLIGFVRGRKMNVYTNDWRVLAG